MTSGCLQISIDVLMTKIKTDSNSTFLITYIGLNLSVELVLP